MRAVCCGLPGSDEVSWGVGYIGIYRGTIIRKVGSLEIGEPWFSGLKNGRNQKKIEGESRERKEE